MMQSREFSLPLRVYIEDTDAGGIVYYVNYLKFMERSRTEFMRDVGFDKNYIFSENMMFVVRTVSVTYLKPAKLDDELVASAGVTRVGGATMTFHQSVSRAGEVLAEGEVTIACVDKAGITPRRIPKIMRDKIQPLKLELDA